jgi:hypothetical protein
MISPNRSTAVGAVLGEKCHQRFGNQANSSHPRSIWMSGGVVQGGPIKTQPHTAETIVPMDGESY